MHEKNNGEHIDIQFAIGTCSLGAALVACSEKGVCAILLGDTSEALAHDLQDRFPKANLQENGPGLKEMFAKVIRLIESPQSDLELPLDMQGTAFQKRVWQELRAVPVGSTISYTELAHRIGNMKAVRAVAQACGANKIAVAIPCHRAVRNDGALSGYRWGVARKRLLLDCEVQSLRDTPNH